VDPEDELEESRGIEDDDTGDPEEEPEWRESRGDVRKEEAVLVGVLSVDGSARSSVES
jgi:hypothetical protein